MCIGRFSTRICILIPVVVTLFVVCYWSFLWFVTARNGMSYASPNFQSLAKGLLHKPVIESYQSLQICLNISSSSLLAATNNDLQVLTLSSKDAHHNLYLFAAYCDRRPTLSNTYVRIFGMIKKNNVGDLNVTDCLLWSQGQAHPILVQARWRVMWGYVCPYHSVMITCQVPAGHDVTTLSHVTVTSRGCDSPPTNVQEVLSSPDSMGQDDQVKEIPDVAVCAKVLYNSPDPIRLIEWIELHHILGAGNIYLYNTSVTGKVNDILRYYSQKGRITLVTHSFPKQFSQALWNRSFPTPNFNQNWELEILSMNDCMYRAKEPYLVNVDIDEVLYINQYANYSDFMDKYAYEHYPKAASLVFKTGVYSNELGEDPDSTIPKYLHTMTHTSRTVIDFESPKSILQRHHCEVAGHHVCLRPLSGFTPRANVLSSTGHLRHYRTKCRLTGEPHKCERLLKNPIKDNRLDKYREKLNRSVRPVLDMFDLL